MIADIIHKVAGMQREESNYYPRPSMSGPDRCLRSMVYSRMGFSRKPLAGRTILIFDDGNWHEELTCDWIKKTAFQMHSSQLKVAIDLGEGMTIYGSIDGIITDLKKVDRLLEHKALNHFTFIRFQSLKAYPVDYFFQGCLYIKGVQKIQPALNEGLLLIKNKNTSAYLEYLFEYDAEDDLCRILSVTDSETCETRKLDVTYHDILKSTREKFNAVEQYATDKTLPPRQYDISDWHCNFCQWAMHCNEEMKKEYRTMSTASEIPEELEERIKFLLYANEEMKELKETQDKVKLEIKEKLKALGVNKVMKDDTVVTLTLQERKTIDRNLIPQSLIDTVTKVSYAEVLRARKVGE